MLNTRELEKRWLRYKIKSYIPHAVILTSIVVILTIIFIFVNTSNQKENIAIKTIAKKAELPITKKVISTPQIEQNNTQVKQTKQTQAIISKIEKTPMLALPKENNKLKLEPSMGFIKHIQSEEQQPYYQTLNPTHTTKKSLKQKKRKIIKQESKIQEEYMDISQKKQKDIKRNIPKIKKEETPQKHVITIERRDSQNDIKEIIRRFQKNNNPALSLFVAKKSYELGNYEQAYNYALITNGINNDIEASWLIFAKSLVKLHRKEMAMKTLREYIKYSHSGNAKALLNEIESGKFQ